jgi:quercetin dioxygenase-like cupin family protein
MALTRLAQAAAYDRGHGVTRLLAGPRLGSSELVVTRHTLWKDTFEGPHSHDREKAVVVLEGRLRVEVDGVEAVLDAGDTLVVRAGEVHDLCSASADVPCEYLVVVSGIVRYFEPDGTEVVLPSIAAAEE